MQFQGNCWVCHLEFGLSCSDAFSYLYLFAIFHEFRERCCGVDPTRIVTVTSAGGFGHWRRVHIRDLREGLRRWTWGDIISGLARWTLSFFKYNLVPRPWMHCKRRVRWPRWSWHHPNWMHSLSIWFHWNLYIYIHKIWPSGWGQQCPEQESQWRWALSLNGQDMQKFWRIFHKI